MSSLKDKYNFDLGYEKGCKDTEAKWKQKLQELLNNFDVIDFLKRHNVKYDEWLKLQFFVFIEEIKKELLKEVEAK